MLNLNRSKNVVLGIAALSMLLVTSAAESAPITYQYFGSWTDSATAPFGATYTASITFDNGGTTVENQNFLQADFVSANVTSGSYNVTIAPGEITGWSIDFSSDALGRLGSGWFNAVPLAGGSWHFDNYYSDETFYAPGFESAYYFSSHISEAGRLAAVPEPAHLTLFGLAAAGAILLRRWKTLA